MSSNRPRKRRGRSLRARLLIAVMVLLAVVSVIIGVVSEVFLHHFLIGQLDRQLMQISGPLHSGGPDHGDGGPRQCFPDADGGGGPPSFALPGTIVGSMDGQLYQVLQSGCTALSAQEMADAQPDGRLDVPYTRDIGDLGSFRLIAESDGYHVNVTGFSLSTVDNTITSLAYIMAAVAGGALVIAGVAGAVIVRRTLRPLRRVADTAGRVAELELDRGDVALSVRVPEQDTDPDTEVGQVGAALNRMLGHVAAALAARQASETRVRQFLADASHELRTPLAAIRGYAELSRRSRADVPPQIAHAMRRVESESARMTTLVNDLLLLARLDSGRPLERDRVDVSRLIVDAVSDAHIAGPQHAWRLDLPPDPVVLTGDSQRLHQVLANLLTNARTHTPPGTTVTTGLRTGRHGDVVITVTDNGPGIPPALLPEVFERFARGDTSRSRSAGSTGLGLAIVAAVVHAHGGHVGVTSQPGNTVFTVTLPHHSSPTGVPQP
jgi:two-component system OmpR family sensor kinase